MNLVVGSTGVLGGEIVRQLRARAEKVRALVRKTSDPAKVEALRAQGAEIVIGDLRDPSSLHLACAGVECVLTTATALSSFSAENSFINADASHKDLIDAAHAAGVGQFVFVSLSSGLNPDADLTRIKRVNEQYLMSSGVPYTILRPSAFMEIWLSPALGFDYVNARAQIIGTGEGRLSYISYVDVAKFCIAAIGNPAVRNQAFDIGGPDAISPLEAVHIFENAVGKRFAVTHIPLEGLQAQHAAAANPLEKTFAALMLETAKGDVVPMQDALRAFPGITLKSVEELARQLVPVAAI
jgi:NADH dehydrogenase